MEEKDQTIEFRPRVRLSVSEFRRAQEMAKRKHQTVDQVISDRCSQTIHTALRPPRTSQHAVQP